MLKKIQMRCQLHILLHITKDNSGQKINYCTIIRQDNSRVCSENYSMKIIMCMISYFICTNFWKIFCILWFQYCSILGDNDNNLFYNYICNLFGSLI